MNDKWKARFKNIWQEWIKPFLIILVIVTSFRSAVADWNDVPTGSMKPTILEGDRIFVNKLAYDLKIPFTTTHIAEWGNPKRGDIVVFFSPDDEKRLVKRVIGVPGDIVEMKNNRLYINDQEISYESAEIPQFENFTIREEFLGEKKHFMMLTPGKRGIRSFGPIEIPEDQYFMMGDNRDNSFDSRWFGLVERDRIVGQVPAVVLSLDREKFYFPRWDRFFTKLP